MCGIVGFTGNRQAAPILLEGLANWNTEDMIQQGLLYEMEKSLLKL